MLAVLAIAAAWAVDSAFLPTATLDDGPTLKRVSLTADTHRPDPMDGLIQSGDSVSVRVTFSVSGGTVTARGLFTGGSTPGDFKVVVKERTTGLADTTTVTVKAASTPAVASSAAPAPSPATQPAPAPQAATGVGIPFGSFGSWDGPFRKANTADFTLSTGSIDPDELVRRLAAARATKHRLLLSMTGGAHRNYITDGVFDINKWKARMDRYATPTIKAAVAQAVVDGTIIGNSVMDEPQNTSAENSWGPAGTMTKERVDEMCGYVKAILPTLPVGDVHDHRVFEPTKSYRTCDFIVSQYRWSKTKGDVAKFRDEALALGRRDGIAIAFSLNILDGGIPSRKGEDCPIQETGGPGTYGRNCRMTAEQVREWAMVLGPAGCALTMWRYDPVFMSNPENVKAFRDVATVLAKAPATSCRRR